MSRKFVGKRNIPAELLRKSCRLHVSSTINCLDTRDKACKRVINGDDTIEKFPREKIKKIKTEPKKIEIKIEERSDQSKGKKQIEDERKNFADCDRSLNPTPKPEGFLEVDLDELDLERTLLGGQSFRWTKTILNNDQPVFTGVILDYALQLWRFSPTRVAFKTLNKEVANIKISTKQELLKNYFQLNYNLKNLYQEWSLNDKHLSECCQQYKGFRILRQDPVENVFSFICATNNNIKRISQMVDKLCRRYGNILEVDDDKLSVYDSFQSFPTVESLAEDDVFQCLRYELGFGYRAKFINETAKNLMELSQEQSELPRDYLLKLRNLPYQDTCKKLMQFPGIGRKVADCICLMSMDHLNSVPIDCHIYEIVCRNYLPKLRQERKTLTGGVHDLIGEYFKNLHGPLAGWSTSVLFIAELKHLKLEESVGKLKKKAKKNTKTNTSSNKFRLNS